jgi:hypothetical protein
MKLPFKPHLLVLLCSAGLFAASGVMFVKSRATETPVTAPAAQQPVTPLLLPHQRQRCKLHLSHRQPTVPRKSISG